MSKCKKNILLIFGYLLFAVFLFVPYHLQMIPARELRGFSKNGFMFTPIFIYNYLANYVNSRAIYTLRVNVWVTEIAVVLVLGGFAYILFCVVLKKEGKK